LQRNFNYFYLAQITEYALIKNFKHFTIQEKKREIYAENELNLSSTNKILKEKAEIKI
jgi:hypothetical protein